MRSPDFLLPALALTGLLYGCVTPRPTQTHETLQKPTSSPATEPQTCTPPDFFVDATGAHILLEHWTLVQEPTDFTPDTPLRTEALLVQTETHGFMISILQAPDGTYVDITGPKEKPRPKIRQLTIQGHEDQFGGIAYGPDELEAEGLIATYYCGDTDADNKRDPREFLADKENTPFVIPNPTPTIQQGVLFPSDRFWTSAKFDNLDFTTVGSVVESKI